MNCLFHFTDGLTCSTPRRRDTATPRKAFFIPLLFGVFFSAGVGHAEFVDSTHSEGMSAVEAAEAEPVLSTTTVVEEASSFIRIVHPKEGKVYPAYLERSFVYGWADPGGILTLNGVRTPVHPGGGWLAMIDYQPGENVFRAILEKEGAVAVVERSVTVGGDEEKPLPPVRSLRPDEDMSVVPGEEVMVSFRGAPGGKAYFQVRGLKGKFPMSEVKGVYRGFFLPPAKPRLVRERFTVHFKEKSGRNIKKVVLGRITVLDPSAPEIVEVMTDDAVLRAGPGFSSKDSAGYVMFPPRGVRFKVTGFKGREFRVEVAQGKEYWISQRDVSMLPPGTRPPRAVAYGAKVSAEGNDGVVRLTLSEKAPFDVTVSEDLKVVNVRFFGTYSNTDWIHLNKDVPWIRLVRWFQDSTDVYRLSIETDVPSWWGYDASYEGNVLVLTLRRPPPLNEYRFPLEGLTIAVDAGHSSDKGAIGVTGTLEKDLNLAIAERLKKKLEADRARVVMIRKGEEHVALYDRPKRAWAARADILISVHNNALPDDKDPFEQNGYGVYYYHLMSLPLAREIHEAYGKMFSEGKNSLKVTMKDDGLHWGNLALPRTSQMPAVLTESVYMIFPPEEWALRQPEFQADCAEAMRRGLKHFARKFRSPR